MFTNGITNGADWYSLAGGLQDYAYIKYGHLSYTIEMSCDKFPDNKMVEKVVQNNKKSVLTWLYYIGEKVPSVVGRFGTGDQKIVFENNFEDGVPKVWTISSSQGVFKKVLPGIGIYDVFVDGSFLRKIFVDGPNRDFDEVSL